MTEIGRSVTEMSDLIRREDAIKAIHREARIAGGSVAIEYADMFQDAIEAVPSADRPQGEWIITEQDNGHKWTHRKCSECGKGIIEPLGVSGMNYCPHCGVQMKGADDE